MPESHLVLVGVLHEDALLHAVGHHSIPPQGRYMGPHHGKHLSNKTVQEATDPPFLWRTDRDTNTLTLNLSRLKS